MSCLVDTQLCLWHTWAHKKQVLIFESTNICEGQVYLIWRKGIATNEKIGQFFNMSYSAVSHCIESFKIKMSKDEKLKKYFDEINSQFKL
jgi:hypothetical protein